MTVKSVFACSRLFSRIVCGISALCLLSLQGCGQTNVRHEDFNHLKDQTSPYLLEHSNDPVNWYPWGDEAFSLAKRENKPVFLSSGFAACHWCHVMQRESFEDPDTAKILNDSFVSIKVDKEERPYVDEVYCRAAQAIGGRAGWPLTVFLTPDKKPFFAGTYFPKTDMHGLPAFTKVLSGVLDSWHKKRSSVDQVANELCLSIYKFDGVSAPREPDRTTIDRAGEKLLEDVDKDFGGLSGERKSALPGTLTLAMQIVASQPRVSWQSNQRTRDYLAYVASTLDHMALGGVQDQLHGGFFRYATDRAWHIPHFEKMLCDNALIAETYLDAGLLTGNSQWKTIGLKTLDFCLQSLNSPEGGFYGSMDADSGGEEGAFYTFTEKEIKAVLGAADGQFFCTVYSVTPKGNTKDGRSVLYFSDSPEKLAKSCAMKLPQFEERLATLKAKLGQSELVRKRARPTVDKKVIAAWNGLMISALVEGYKVSGEEKYLAAAKNCAHFLIKNLCQDKSIQRIWAGGKAHVSGCLDDYAYNIRAFLDLAEVDSDSMWLTRASALNETAVGHFYSHHAGFYYTANNKDQALVRTGCARDVGVPSPLAIEVSNVLRLYELHGDEHLRSVSQRTMKLYDDSVMKEPTAFGYLLSAMEQTLYRSERLVILQGTDKVLAKQLSSEVWQFYAPHMVVALVEPKQFAAITRFASQGQSGFLSPPSSQGGVPGAAPGAGPGNSAAYFCSAFTNSCDKPITDPAQLKAKLADLAAHGGL